MFKDDLKRFINIPTIVTDRLILRKIVMNDLLDVNKYARDPMVTAYLLWDPHPTLSFTKSYLSLIGKKYKRTEYYDWGVEYNGHIIGTCGFTSFSVENNSAEIGYVIGSPYWGMGIATEAVRRVIEYGFEELSLNRIEARYIAGNERSLAVMKKCHMTYEATLRDAVYSKDAYKDVCITSILRREYEQLRALGTF